jgi:hypothetical protein
MLQGNMAVSVATQSTTKGDKKYLNQIRSKFGEMAQCNR